jgi:aldehyde:ferredoxin oxidoreductase
VCAFSPQAYPHGWFTRSSIGAHFGGELKRAGYDGVVVTGASETPVRICIRDDEVRVLPADDLWGLDTMDALQALESIEGQEVRSLVIGPAGERLSRIATIHTASSSASGQGGFGGVMGSKKLKAISVIGTGRVSLADPDRIAAIARAVAREGEGWHYFGHDIAELNRQLAAEGGGTARWYTCTEGCVTPCQVEFQDVPGCAYDRKWSGSWFCVAAFAFPGSGKDTPEPLRSVLDWQLERRAAFEMNVLSNRYGLNQFDVLAGIVPWLIACQKGRA